MIKTYVVDAYDVSARHGQLSRRRAGAQVCGTQMETVVRKVSSTERLLERSDKNLWLQLTTRSAVLTPLLMGTRRGCIDVGLVAKPHEN